MIELVLIRHGQSIWNLENRFTGWTDVELSENGINEAKKAGILLKNNNYHFDIAYTSVLKRANDTLNIVLNELGENVPIIYDYRLNERHYGALQGLNKDETKKKYGEEQVKLWRRSADTRPPELDMNDERFPGHDPKYKDIDISLLPKTENLIDTMNRVLECYNESIKFDLLKKKRVLIVAHGNSLRSLVKYLENLSNDEIMNIEIPTGKPLIYTLDDNLKFISKKYL